MELTPTFVSLLQEFASVFTRPSFVFFVYLLTGWTLTCRHRFITECIFTSGRVGDGHWSRFHRFFSHNRWSLDYLFMLLAKLLIRVFAPKRIPGRVAGAVAHPGSHRSGRAQLRHPARQVTASLRTVVPTPSAPGKADTSATR